MYTLNAEQARQLDRFQTTEIFCHQNKDKYAILKPFQQRVEELAATNKKINTYIPVRSTSGEGATTEKGELKLIIASSVNSICSLVIPYALETGDAELYNAVNFTTSDVRDLRDVAVLGFVTTIVGVVTPLLSRPDFKEYPVTAEELDKLTRDAGTFNDNLSNNKIINNNSSIASANINALLAANRVIISRLNKLINYFEDKDPDFADGYHKAAAVNNTGIHHSGVKGIIINSNTGQPVKEVSVVIKGKKYTKTTTAGDDGVYAITKFTPGKCTLTFTVPGYESHTVEITIIRGKTLGFNISLQSQVLEFKTA